MPYRIRRRPNPSDRVFTVPEIADELDVSDRSVYRWISEGYLPAKRDPVSHVYQVDVADLEAFKADYLEEVDEDDGED